MMVPVKDDETWRKVLRLTSRSRDALSCEGAFRAFGFLFAVVWTEDVFGRKKEKTKNKSTSKEKNDHMKYNI